MAASFNPALTNPVSRVRQRIGDTDVAKAEFDDATINAYLNSLGLTETKTAARLCWDLSAKYARKADVDVDDQMQRFSQISKRFGELAMRLDAEAAAEGPTSVATDPTAGIIVMTSDQSRAGYLYGLECYPPSNN